MVMQIDERGKLNIQRHNRQLRQQRMLHANGNAMAVQTSGQKKKLTIHDLGWTPEQALANHYRFKIFEEDWHAPGMEIYDED